MNLSYHTTSTDKERRSDSNPRSTEGRSVAPGPREIPFSALRPAAESGNNNQLEPSRFALISSSDSSLTPLITRIVDLLQEKYPQPNPRWGFSTNNSPKDNWLLTSPCQQLPVVWGTPYDKFKMAETGEGFGYYDDFDLKIYLGSSSKYKGKGVVTELYSTVKEVGGKPPFKLIAGHSYQLYERIYDLMISAEKFLDFTTLTPPTGRFLAAFKNGIAYLSTKDLDKRPIIRILFSSPSGLDLTAEAFLQEITKEIENSPLQIYVIVLRSSATSWNHSKILAADGVRAIVGGHNLWGEQYLDQIPVFDVSMEIYGDAALHAQDYANSLWNYVFTQQQQSLNSPYIPSMKLPLFPSFRSIASYQYNQATGKNEIDNDLPSPDLYQKIKGEFQHSSEAGIPIISAGRTADADPNAWFPLLDSYLFPIKEPSDDAFIKMIQLATDKIWFSLQSFRLFGKRLSNNIFDQPPVQDTFVAWNNRLFLALGKAIQRQVEVKVILSNPNAFGGGLLLAPYNGEPPSIIYEKMRLVMTGRLGIEDAVAKTLIERHFSVGSIRYYSQEVAYPPSDPIPNHAKTVMVDDRLFYIGSQNLYVCNLNEFGYFVESVEASQEYRKKYWDPLFSQSKWESPSYDLDLDLQEKVEAVDFLASLTRNSRLRLSFDRLDDEEIDDEEQFNQSLNDILTNAGFLTTPQRVREVHETLFIVNNNGNYQANDESNRFVLNLLTDRQLLTDFAKIVTEVTDYQEGITTINQFLSDKGYQCELFQVQTSLELLQQQFIGYWAGTYATFLNTDGGNAFFPPNTTFRANRLSDSSSQVYKGPQVVISGLDHITVDGSVLKDPIYKDGTLSWSSEKNTTSGELTFGEVTRPGLLDSFVGREFFGEIVYPDSGTFPKNGIVSVYGRHVDDDSQRDPKDPFPWKVLTVAWGSILGVITVLGMSLLIKRTCSRCLRAIKDKYKKDDQGSSSEGRELEPMLSEGQVKEIQDNMYAEPYDPKQVLTKRHKPNVQDEYQEELKEISQNLDTFERAISEIINKGVKKIFETTIRPEEGSVMRLQQQAVKDNLEDLRENLTASVSRLTRITDPIILKDMVNIAIIQPRTEELTHEIESAVTTAYGNYLAENNNQIRGEIGKEIADAIDSAHVVDWNFGEKSIQEDIYKTVQDALNSYEDKSEIFQSENVADMINTATFKEIVRKSLSRFVDASISNNLQSAVNAILRIDLFKQLSEDQKGRLQEFGDVMANLKFSEMERSINHQPSYLDTVLEYAISREKRAFLNDPVQKEKIAQQIEKQARETANRLEQTKSEIESQKRSKEKELQALKDKEDHAEEKTDDADLLRSLEQELQELVEREKEIQEQMIDETRKIEDSEGELKERERKLEEQENDSREKVEEAGRKIFGEFVR